MTKATFHAILERPEGIGTWTYLTVPFDARKRFGSKGRIRIRGTVNGEPFKSTLLPRGDGSHHLVLPKPLRDKAQITEGSRVRVVLEADSLPRTVVVAADFKAALRECGDGSLMFEKLAPSHRKSYVDWIESAKQTDTRQRRIKAAVEMICAGRRLKG